jgi:hypothetical protein
MPDSTPAELMVAMLVLALLQVPPVVALARVVVAFSHTTGKPVMGVAGVVTVTVVVVATLPQLLLLI